MAKVNIKSEKLILFGGNFQVGNFFNRFFKTDRHIVAVCLLSPLHILSITEPMTKPAMAPSTLCVWANPLKSPIHLINPIVVLILPAIISVSHVISKQITRNRPFPVPLGPVSAPVYPCFAPIAVSPTPPGSVFIAPPMAQVAG